MKIVERRVYRGPNPYAHFPVMRVLLDLGALEQWPSAKIPSFVDGLMAAMPSLSQHGCSYREPGGFERRLREGEGTWLGHVLEHVAIELQQLTSASVTFGKTRSADDPGPGHPRQSGGNQAGRQACRARAQARTAQACDTRSQAALNESAGPPEGPGASGFKEVPRPVRSPGRVCFIG